jgi:tRNA(fMet)-specific endonuclease VapC
VKPRFLLDTNVVSEPTRPRPHANVIAHLRAFEYELAVAATTWHEIIYGVQRLPMSRRRLALERYYQSVRADLTILPYDEGAAEWHAAERVRLVPIGLTLPFADGQIAAVAAVNGLVLVTANVAEFRHFAGITLDNWHV